MRKFVLAATVAAMVAVPPALPPAGAADPRAQVGEVSPWFMEPYPAGVTPYGASGCYTNPDGTRDCLPSGASQNVLPDGRLLYWNAIEGSEDIPNAIAFDLGTALGDSRTRLLTLGASPSWAAPPHEDAHFDDEEGEPLLPGSSNDNGDYSDGSLFCSDNTFLADGRVIAAGGTDYYSEPGAGGVGAGELEGLAETRVFDPAVGPAGDWVPAGKMAYTRWYPSLVNLADGRTLVASGVSKLGKPLYPERPSDSGRNVVQTETFDPASGTWSTNPESANRSLPLFARLHLLPNGKVYYDAAGQAFNPFGQSYDEALWNVAAVYDPVTQSWSDLGIPGLGTATMGFRGSTFSAALPLRAPYDTARYLTAGGVLGTTPGSYVPTAASRIAEVGTGAAAESFRTIETGPLNEARWYGSGVVLPNGEVLAISGGDLDGVVSPSSERPIRHIELFTAEETPAGAVTGGEWRRVAEVARPRTYHNTAVLLPDGRVLIGGNDPITNGYGKQQDNPSLPFREAANNSPDASFEIYSPPYLFDDGGPAARPVITAASPVAVHGQPLELEVSDASEVAKVVLVRNPSVTHLIDGDERVVDLEFEASGSALVASVPASPAVVPPGPYMLFVLDGDGTPSLAKQVAVGGVGIEQPEPPPATPPAAAALAPPDGDDVVAPRATSAAPAVVRRLGAMPAASRRPAAPMLPPAVAALGALGLAAGRWRRRTRTTAT